MTDMSEVRRAAPTKKAARNGFEMLSRDEICGTLRAAMDAVEGANVTLTSIGRLAGKDYDIRGLSKTAAGNLGSLHCELDAILERVEKAGILGEPTATAAASKARAATSFANETDTIDAAIEAAETLAGRIREQGSHPDDATACVAELAAILSGSLGAEAREEAMRTLRAEMLKAEPVEVAPAASPRPDPSDDPEANHVVMLEDDYNTLCSQLGKAENLMRLLTDGPLEGSDELPALMAVMQFIEEAAQAHGTATLIVYKEA